MVRRARAMRRAIVKVCGNKCSGRARRNRSMFGWVVILTAAGKPRFCLLNRLGWWMVCCCCLTRCIRLANRIRFEPRIFQSWRLLRCLCTARAIRSVHWMK